MKLSIIILLFAIIIVETIGAIFLNKASKNGNNILLLLGIIAYIFVAILFYWLVKLEKNMAIVNTIWQAANIVIVTTISYFIFKENLNNMQILGIILSCVGILLINYYSI
jgi:multidrug transporter EmrE-like cation transporter